MKILGSDYDGTLKHGGMSEGKLLAIKNWREAGHRFGIVSGRGKDFRETLLQETAGLELDFFAAHNGAYIVDQNGATIYEARCNTVLISEFVKELLSWSCRFVHIYGEWHLCVAEKYEDFPSYVSEDCRCLFEDLPPIDYFNQISIRFPSVEESSDIVEKIRKKYEKWLNPLQNGRCIDIVPRGVDKAQGMYRVMEFFGGTCENVITVGDNINDIDMIREFRS